MTVSNAFSRPDQLSPAMGERIFAAAQELGYAGPDPTARALAKSTNGAVGIVLTDSLRYAFTDLTVAIARARAGDPAEPRQILLPTELIVRESTAAPKPTAVRR